MGGILRIYRNGFLYRLQEERHDLAGIRAALLQDLLQQFFHIGSFTRAKAGFFDTIGNFSVGYYDQ